MLVVAAGAMVVLLGFIGLVVDLGWSSFQKRVAQNAADAAVFAALRDLATAGSSCDSATLHTAVSDHITSFAQANGGADTTTSSFRYIDDNNTTVATADNCTQATGVEVTATNPYNTFFLSIIGIGTGSTNATAAGRVGALRGLNNGSPFVACGSSLVRYKDPMPAPPYETVNIMLPPPPNNPPLINPGEVGNTFFLHDPQLTLHGGDCGVPGGSFKGLAEDTDCSLPCDYGWTSGAHAGPTRTEVSGMLPACDLTSNSGTDVGIDGDCVLFVPIADGVGTSPSDFLNVVTFAAFVIHRIDANTHTGTLLDKVFTQGPTTGWVPGSTGILVLGLIK